MEQDAPTHGLAPAPLGPPFGPKPGSLQPMEERERETPNLRLFGLQGHGQTQAGGYLAGFERSPHISWEDERDLLRGPGAAPGPQQQREVSI